MILCIISINITLLSCTLTKSFVLLIYRFPIQNIPIRAKYPAEFHSGLWGGEGIIQGFTRKKIKVRRNPEFWIPSLKQSVVYSEILDKYMSVTVTERTIRLIHQHSGFDHYILKVVILLLLWVRKYIFHI